MSNRMRYINPQGASPAQGLYSHVTRVESGPLYFIAGQLAVGPDGNVVGKGDFAAQFRQVFDNLKAVLEGLGASYSDVVRFNTFLVHSQHIEPFMKLRAEYFPTVFPNQKYPPNTLLIVDRLVKEDFLIEVEAIAIAKNES